MKKFMLLIAAVSAIGLGACKKDRSCKCTISTTDPDGSTNTELDNMTTYTKIKKSDAKSRCQNYTVVSVDPDGGTTTTKGECKLN